MNPWLLAGLICVAAAGFEGLCAGRDPMGQLRGLNQPSWSPPNWVWVLIGIAWYGICFTGLARLLQLWPEQKLPVVLLVTLMVLNAAANIPIFRTRRLDLALAFLTPYGRCLPPSFGRSGRSTASRSGFSQSTRFIKAMRRLGAISFGG